MKKITLLTVSLFCLATAMVAQQGVARITQNYFRSDPFTSEFSAFLQHLISDPDIQKKVVKKRTDSTLFVFTGEFKSFNPFFFKPKRVEVMLSEAQVKFKDSTAFDTIYVYEIAAYNDATPGGTQEIRKEFDKIYRKYKRTFPKSSYVNSKPESTVKYEIYNFFDPRCAIAPFGVAWWGPDDNREIYLALTIRFDNFFNEARLPIPLYAP